jgi:hypothetical protein
VKPSSQPPRRFEAIAAKLRAMDVPVRTLMGFEGH